MNVHMQEITCITNLKTTAATKRCVNRLLNFLLWALIATIPSTGCDNTHPPSKPKGEPMILASSFPAFCLVQEICQSVDGLQVASWIPTDISPHDYQLRPQDMLKLRDARVVVRIGLDFEPALDKAIKANGSIQRLTLSSFLDETNFIHHSENTNSAEPGNHGHIHGEINPHLWLDPALLIQMSEGLAKALSLEFPNFQDQFEDNLTHLKEELLKIDKNIQDVQNQISKAPFLTQHDAFAYFFKRYELNWAGWIESASDWNLEPQRISKILQQSRNKAVKVIFLERGSHQRPPDSLLKDLAIPIATLDPMETGVYQPGAFQITLNKNLETLKSNLIR